METSLPATGSTASNSDIVAARSTEATTASSSTSTSASTVATATSSTTAVHAHLCQFRGNLLLGLTQDSEQLSRALAVLRREEGDGRSLGSCSPCSSDLMDVVLGVGREVVVDDVANVLDICWS